MHPGRLSTAIAARLLTPDPRQIIFMPWVVAILFLKIPVGLSIAFATGPLPEFVPDVQCQLHGLTRASSPLLVAAPLLVAGASHQTTTEGQYRDEAGAPG